MIIVLVADTLLLATDAESSASGADMCLKRVLGTNHTLW